MVRCSPVLGSAPSLFVVCAHKESIPFGFWAGSFEPSLPPTLCDELGSRTIQMGDAHLHAKMRWNGEWIPPFGEGGRSRGKILGGARRVNVAGHVQHLAGHCTSAHLCNAERTLLPQRLHLVWRQARLHSRFQRCVATKIPAPFLIIPLLGFAVAAWHRAFFG